MMTSAQIQAYLRYIALFMAFFIPVFIGGGLIGGLATHRVSLHLVVENSFPFVPEAVWAYLSLYTIFVLPLIHLSVEDMTRLGRQSVFIILVSGPFYVFLPALNNYPQPEVTGLQGIVIDTIRRVDILHNLVPSLHIAFAWLILLEARRKVCVGLGLVYLGWAGIVTVSTVLLHRHYLLDLASGFALALLARRLFPFKPQEIADAQ
jgi:membrane-associated phospholipid phosphatase